MRLPGRAGPLPAEPGRGVCRGNEIALLGALCFFLSAVEYLIPKPLPFMRIGLANMPLLLALNVLDAKGFFLLVSLKVLGQALIGGTFLSFVFPFSLAGTFASASVMYVLGGLPGKKRLGFAGIGCAGAMVSNSVQLLLARHMVFGEAVRYLAPPFLAAGFLAGIGLGMACEYFSRRSLWYASLAGNADAPPAASGRGPDMFSAKLSKAAGRIAAVPSAREERRKKRSKKWDRLFGANLLFAAGLVMALVFLHDRSLPGHAARFLFFCLLAFLSGKRIGLPTTAAFMAGIVFFNLLVPHGRVLFSVGPLAATEGSLLVGLERALTLAGLLMLSRACVRGGLRLPGAIGSLLAESLRTLELMREKKALLSGGSPVAGLDRMLLELRAENASAPVEAAPREKPRRGAKGVFLLCAMAAFAFAIGFLPFGL